MNHSDLQWLEIDSGKKEQTQDAVTDEQINVFQLSIISPKQGISAWRGTRRLAAFLYPYLFELVAYNRMYWGKGRYVHFCDCVEDKHITSVLFTSAKAPKEVAAWLSISPRSNPMQVDPQVLSNISRQFPTMGLEYEPDAPVRPPLQLSPDREAPTL